MMRPLRFVRTRSAPRNGHARQRREHADNGVRLIVHLEDLADDVRITRETFLPEVVAEQEHRRRSLLVFSGQEGAAEERFHSESIKKIVRYDSGLDTLRFGAAEEDEPHRVIFRESRERAGLLPEVGEIRNRKSKGVVADFGRSLMKNDEAFRRFVRQWPHQHAIDNGKDGRVRADAETERENDDRGEAGIANDPPQTVAAILAEMVDEAQNAFVHFRLFFFFAGCARGSAKFRRNLLGVTRNRRVKARRNESLP